jgi:hypothetical protein
MRRTGVCKRCYRKQYRAAHAEYFRQSNRTYRRQTFNQAWYLAHALEILCGALNCQPREIARYILELPGGGQPRTEPAAGRWGRRAYESRIAADERR